MENRSNFTAAFFKVAAFASLAALTPVAQAENLNSYPAAGYTPLGGVAQGKLVNPAANTDNGMYRENLKSTYNEIGGENDFKAYMWSGWNGDPMTGSPKIDWTGADAVAQFARDNGQRMRGHCLVYHSVIPSFLNPSGDNKTPGVSPTGERYTDAQIQHMVHVYIAAVMRRYADIISNWDVTNELFDGDGKAPGTWYGGDVPINDFWIQHLGGGNLTTYFNHIYGWAREAVPNAKLYYCDFSTEYPGAKFQGMLNTLVTLKRNGCPIDGVSFQCHESTDNPTQRLSTENTKAVDDAGLQWRVTEFDCWTPVANPNWSLQSDIYRTAVSVCTQDRNCGGFMVWGSSDKYSWESQKNGLMFDQNYAKKAAYWAVDDVYAHAPALGPAGYSFQGREGTTANFMTPVDAAFGDGGACKFLYARNGKIAYTSKNFGDPLPGKAKYGYYRDFHWAAPEGGVKHFDTPVEAAFGANGVYRYKWNASGNVSFVPGTFGGSDPAPGYVKAGYYMPYAWCAGENGKRRFSSPVDVAYGANGHYLFRRKVTGTVIFNKAAWSSIGPDPAPGVAKAGYFRPSH